MRVTQYFTDKTHSMKVNELFPALEMGGAHTVEISDTPLPTAFDGFGVAITGSSCYELSLMDADERKELLKSIYSTDGLALSIGRLTIGASDYSAELYSYDDVPNDTGLKYFSIERDEKYIIPMIREILEINPNLKLFASPWSPPGWMKTGGQMCGGYMRAEYIDCYADYIVRFIEEYEQHGVHISAITPQNEPETQQSGRMPACIWHPDMEAKFIECLREKLDKKELGVKIWMYDHNFSGWKRVMWTLDKHTELDKKCDGVAFHYYSGAIEDVAPLQKQYPNLEYHFTEGGPRLYDNYDTDWCKWSIMMSKTMSSGFSSFCGWNLMLDETGGPNIGPFFCGGLVTRNTLTGELSYSGQYKAFGHISHFIRSDAKIYPVNICENNTAMFGYPKTGEPIVACGIENTDGSFVLIITNHNNDKRQLQVFRDGEWWYIEMLPDSVSTVVFEKE